jgi:DNA-3-methyladenine glycosylase II
MNSILVPLPREFSPQLNLSFLRRSPRELLHRFNENTVLKALNPGEDPVLLSIFFDADHLEVNAINRTINEDEAQWIKNYISRWFDLTTDLKPFYQLTRDDKLLGPLVRQFYGYRIVGQPDLFESLVWAVLGQQINLSFAYTLKERFVRTYGRKIVWDDVEYFLFPTAEEVAQLAPGELLKLQFSRQKAAYTIGIAREFAGGTILQENLTRLPFQEAKDELMKIKGVGNWTANYALMKTFQYPNAFPLEDAGLHNALRIQMGLKAKPSLERIKKIFRKYKGWEAYATLYLWKSL